MVCTVKSLRERPPNKAPIGGVLSHAARWNTGGHIGFEPGGGRPGRGCAA